MSDIPIDKTTLATLKDVMEGEYPALLEAYLDDSEARIHSLQRALDHRDAELLRQEAHSFKGSCGNMGAQQLADLCLQLETLARQHELTQAAQVMVQIKQGFTAVRGVLKQELQQLKT